MRSAGNFSDAGRAEMRTSPCELGVLEKADESSAEVAGDGDSSEAYGIVTGAVDMVVRTASRAREREERRSRRLGRTRPDRRTVDLAGRELSGGRLNAPEKSGSDAVYLRRGLGGRT